MSETGQPTPPQSPAATGGATPPAATKPEGGAGATNDGDTVTLKQEDYKKLISARDRANNSNSDALERLDQIEGFALSMAKEHEIDDFLSTNQEKFPDVTRDDLMTANSAAELEALATKQQRRFEDVVQKKLMDVQRFNAPVLTPEQRSEKEAELKKNPGKNSFADMVRLRMSPK